MRQLTPIVLLLLLSTGCEQDGTNQTAQAISPPASLDAVARDYVHLTLAMGEVDADHVDAYFGPEHWRQKAIDEDLDFSQIIDRAQSLRGSLKTIVPATELERARKKGLQLRLRALLTRARIAQGRSIPFDRETRDLFDAEAAAIDEAHFAELLREIDALTPGTGPLSERVAAFEAQFHIPAERLDDVFSAAIAECRRRTLEHLTLPEGESFTVEYVVDKPWSGYNWYQGNAYSLIQINTSLPIGIDRAVDLGCHEGYPGHHTYNALLEQTMVESRGWVEFSVYPLFSPQSLIAEGSANFGIDLAFPGDERLRYERDILFPLAGLDPTRVESYYRLQGLKDQLSHAANSAARRYLDGDADRATTEEWLVEYALMTPERAAQRVDFFETYRSYVINYNVGRDLVADWVAREAAAGRDRWKAFAELLSTPINPSDLTN